MKLEDAGKAPGFLVRQEEPFNGGPPPAILRQHAITPNEWFFVRNHGAIPALEARTHQLTIEGRVGRPRTYSLTDLFAHFERREIVAAVQCAGNRRDEMASVEPIPGELPWGSEAISNALWSGVSLAEVLAACEVAVDARHVEFEGLDETERHGHRFFFGGSIPLAKALSPEVLLADRLNGEPLPPTHGFPLRVVVPGYIGARSVKWVRRIVVRDEPSPNYFQSKAYRLFPPSTRADTVVWEDGIALGDFPVGSIICGVDRRGESSLHSVAGVALAGGGRRVVHVEVSGSGGSSWTDARLLDSSDGFAWTRWEADIHLPSGADVILARARDEVGNTQPESPAQLWNFKGYLNHAWARWEL